MLLNTKRLTDLSPGAPWHSWMMRPLNEMKRGQKTSLRSSITWWWVRTSILLCVCSSCSYAPFSLMSSCLQWAGLALCITSLQYLRQLLCLQGSEAGDIILSKKSLPLPFPKYMQRCDLAGMVPHKARTSTFQLPSSHWATKLSPR